MNNEELVKLYLQRFLAFIIDVLIIYSSGLLLFLILGDYNKFEKLEFVCVYVFFVSFLAFYLFSKHNFSFGRKIFKLSVVKLEENKSYTFFFLLRAILITILIAPFTLPYFVFPMYLIIIIIFNVISLYERKMLAIDQITNITIVSKNAQSIQKTYFILQKRIKKSK